MVKHMCRSPNDRFARSARPWTHALQSRKGRKLDNLFMCASPPHLPNVTRNPSPSCFSLRATYLSLMSLALRRRISSCRLRFPSSTFLAARSSSSSSSSKGSTPSSGTVIYRDAPTKPVISPRITRELTWSTTYACIHIHSLIIRKMVDKNHS